MAEHHPLNSGTLTAPAVGRRQVSPAAPRGLSQRTKVQERAVARWPMLRLRLRACPHRRRDRIRRNQATSAPRDRRRQVPRALQSGSADPDPVAPCSSPEAGTGRADIHERDGVGLPHSLPPMRAPRCRSAARPLRTTNRSVTRPGQVQPAHRHDVGRARAADRSELEHRRCRIEAQGAVRAHRCVAPASRRKQGRAGRRPQSPLAVPNGTEAAVAVGATDWRAERLPEAGLPASPSLSPSIEGHESRRNR